MVRACSSMCDAAWLCKMSVCKGRQEAGEGEGHGV